MTIRKTIRDSKSYLVIDIWYRDLEGKRKRYRRDAQVQTMTAAKSEERRLIALLAARGTIPSAEELAGQGDEREGQGGTATFQDAVEYFRKEKMLLLKPSTRTTYNNILDSELLPRLGDQLLADIGPRELSEMDARLAKRKVTASTRRNYQVVLRSVLKAAKVGGLLEEVPRLPPLPKVGSKVARIPFAAEINAVIEAAKPCHRVALALAAYAGLRAGEIRGLRKRDVDLVGGVIVVRQAICRGVAAPPKSGHEREIPIAAPLRPFLTEALTRCPTFDSPVAPTSKGSVWSEQGLHNMLVSLQRKLGLKGWTMHTLRHSFVSTLFRKGASAPTVQKLAGHLHLSVTQRYAHSTREDLQAAIATL